ncbi:hypothetical protein LTR49_026160 [Elasticomyces elasticus]|nr:hypothetical protein LTR49_026160 [Elasticomyces elasticus]
MVVKKSRVEVVLFVGVEVCPTPKASNAGTTDFTLARWIVNGALTVVSDLLAVALSVYLVWDLQMGMNSKALVITAFTLRMSVLPITIIRLISLSNVDTDDFSLSYSLPEAYTQAEMHCSLIATTPPCLRLFFTSWNTNFMNLRLEEIDLQAYQEHKSSANKLYANKSFLMSAMKSGKNSQSATKHPSHSRWRPHHHGTSTAVVGTGHWADDAASDNPERAIVVKQTVTVDQG